MSTKPVRSSAWFDARLTLPLGFTRAYVVITLGRDQRAGAAQPIAGRSEYQRKQTPWMVAAASVLVLTWALVAVMALTVVVLYLLKSWAGVDLVPGGQPMQTLFRAINLCH